MSVTTPCNQWSYDLCNYANKVLTFHCRILLTISEWRPRQSSWTEPTVLRVLVRSLNCRPTRSYPSPRSSRTGTMPTNCTTAPTETSRTSRTPSARWLTRQSAWASFPRRGLNSLKRRPESQVGDECTVYHQFVCMPWKLSTVNYSNQINNYQKCEMYLYELSIKLSSALYACVPTWTKPVGWI